MVLSRGRPGGDSWRMEKPKTSEQAGSFWYRDQPMPSVVGERNITQA